MKILIVQESDWLKRNPHQQHHLMDRMSVRGHEVRVIDYPIDWSKDELKKGLIYPKKTYYNISKINKNADIQVIRPKFIKLPIINYISLIYTHKKEIKKQINEFNPDIIVALGILNSYIASKLSRKYNIPFVYYLIDALYTLIPEKIFQPFGKIINKKTIGNSDLVITINQKLKELAIELGADENKTVIVDAGIDLNEFDSSLDDSNLREEYGISEDEKVLFFMGWIYNFAGMKELAIELGKNKNKYSNMKIVIVGDGDAYDELVRIKNEYNLDDQLILTGKQQYTRIPEFLSLADFCLLPAYKDEEIMQDIVPIKLYEYLAMEKVVIATKLPGIYEEFGENNGIVYINEAKEVLSVAQRIIDDNNYDLIAKQSVDFVKNKDWDIIVGNFEKILNELI